jgi:hypothetical protein
MTFFTGFLRTATAAVRFIDCLQGQGEGLAYYIRELEKRPYTWGAHFAPPDIKVRELGTGKSRLEQARALDIKFEVVANLPVVDGIAAVRVLLQRSYFDQVQFWPLLQALAAYRREWSARLGVYGAPRHDASSHFADAVRYAALSERDREPEAVRGPFQARMACPPLPTMGRGGGLSRTLPSRSYWLRIGWAPRAIPRTSS